MERVRIRATTSSGETAGGKCNCQAIRWTSVEACPDRPDAKEEVAAKSHDDQKDDGVVGHRHDALRQGRGAEGCAIAAKGRRPVRR